MTPPRPGAAANAANAGRNGSRRNIGTGLGTESEGCDTRVHDQIRTKEIIDERRRPQC